MKSETNIHIKVADHVWIATALLHLENPQRTDFSKQEIRERAEKEDAGLAARPGISQHISTHCVASKPPNPAKHRMLTRTGTGRRRLFREGDKVHPGREGGSAVPEREDLPEKYHSLLDWYERDYNLQTGRTSVPVAGTKDSVRAGTSGAVLFRFWGIMSQERAREFQRIIEEGCERIDP
jgi:hypothetical protein